MHISTSTLSPSPAGKSMLDGLALALSWNPILGQAPKNTVVLVQDKQARITWAYFDPDWGGGRGGWFNRHNHAIQISAWRADGDYYVQYMRLTERLNGFLSY
jgi:hypothetical protein